MTDALFGSDGTQPAGEVAGDAVSDEAAAARAADRPADDPDDEVPTPPSWPAVVAAIADRPGPSAAVRESAPAPPPTFVPTQPPTRPARPPVQDAEPSLYGLTRRSRTRAGQLAFKLIFLTIFLLIAVQTIVVLLTGG